MPRDDPHLKQLCRTGQHPPMLHTMYRSLAHCASHLLSTGSTSGPAESRVEIQHPSIHHEVKQIHRNARDSRDVTHEGGNRGLCASTSTSPTTKLAKTTPEYSNVSRDSVAHQERLLRTRGQTLQRPDRRARLLHRVQPL